MRRGHEKTQDRMLGLPAAFWRGGTSNGLLIHRKDLPEDIGQWSSLLCPVMGSPDPYRRQLNGMGGGISSLSKICVVSPSVRSDADVDYTFIQVGIMDESLDMAGNCGNMLSSIGPFALDEGLIPASTISRSSLSENGQDMIVVRIFNKNTTKIIHSKFAVRKTDSTVSYEAHGDYTIDGVSGTASPITLSFLSPGGSKTGRVFPSGNRTDHLTLPDGSTVLASLVDVANPGVFVRAADIGVTLPIDEAKLDGDAGMMAKIAEIRRLGASRMGLDPNIESVPKILLLSEPDTGETYDIRTLALSMGQSHKAVPLTLSLNLGVACRLEGTVPSALKKAACSKSRAVLTIAHPSGTLDVQAEIDNGEIKSATLIRTARLLMKGEVNVA